METNLDAYADANDLMEFWQRYAGGAHYRELFPAGGKGSILATADLANYAANKATAMRLRARGNIREAIIYENICDRIYSKLPDTARFW